MFYISCLLRLLIIGLSRLCRSLLAGSSLLSLKAVLFLIIFLLCKRLLMLFLPISVISLLSCLRLIWRKLSTLLIGKPSGMSLLLWISRLSGPIGSWPVFLPPPFRVYSMGLTLLGFPLAGTSGRASPLSPNGIPPLLLWFTPWNYSLTFPSKPVPPYPTGRRLPYSLALLARIRTSNLSLIRGGRICPVFQTFRLCSLASGS